MKAKYEYKFVRVGEGKLKPYSAAKRNIFNEYQQVIQDHAKDGWRFVQIFAPAMSGYGGSTYIECIFEREIS